MLQDKGPWARLTPRVLQDQGCLSECQRCVWVQDNGSLRDLLSNETVAIEGELLHPIVKDICQGASRPHYIAGSASRPPYATTPPRHKQW